MSNQKTAWRVDDENRLLSPDGAFVALFKDGVIYFYDKKRGSYAQFTMADWWSLIASSLETPSPPPVTSSSRRSAGAWGEK